MRPVVWALVGVLILAPVALTAAASAAPTISSLPACPGNQATASVEDLYVRAASIRSELWRESNGLGGLQTFDCRRNGVDHAKDTMLAQGVPQDLGILGLCVNVGIIGQCF